MSAGISNDSSPPAVTKGLGRARPLPAGARTARRPSSPPKRPYAGSLRRDQRLDRSEANRAADPPDLGIRYASFRAEPDAGAIGVAEHERRAERIGDVVPEQLLEHVRHRGITRRPLERVAHRDGEPPARLEHPHHFPKPAARSSKEHQTELTDGRVESCRPQRKVSASARPSRQSMRVLLRRATAEDMSALGSETDHRALRADPIERGKRQHARAARDVESRGLLCLRSVPLRRRTGPHCRNNAGRTARRRSRPGIYCILAARRALRLRIAASPLR